MYQVIFEKTKNTYPVDKRIWFVSDRIDAYAICQMMATMLDIPEDGVIEELWHGQIKDYYYHIQYSKICIQHPERFQKEILPRIT